MAATGNVLLRVSLRDTQDPAVSRILSISPYSSFAELYRAIQISFGWRDLCPSEFRMYNPASNSLLASITPLVRITSGEGDDEDHPRRRASASSASSAPPSSPSSSSSWLSSRTHLSAIRWVPPLVENQDQIANEALQLSDMFCRHNPNRFEYVYDPDDDNWIHDIEYLGRTVQLVSFPSCLAGEGHHLAEGVGGTDGWNHLKRIYSYPLPTDRQRELMRWYEATCPNGDERGLRGAMAYVWDISSINSLLQMDAMGNLN